MAAGEIGSRRCNGIASATASYDEVSLASAIRSGVMLTAAKISGVFFLS